jgi:hypothetical protein
MQLGFIFEFRCVDGFLFSRFRRDWGGFSMGLSWVGMALLRVGTCLLRVGAGFSWVGMALAGLGWVFTGRAGF